ncbi:MAG TPA: glycosyltransferase family 39 protein, partial [Candidatus Eisenbacteria bacterium]
MAAARTQPGPSARPAWADPAVALTLVAVVLAGLLVFRHRGAIADPDALDMAAGMANGLKRGVPPGEWLLYGRLVSPGAYLGFHALVPLLHLGPEHTIGFLNAVSLAAMALLPWPLFALYRRRFDPAVAAAATLITAFTPLVWSAGCSFHPIGPAVLLLLLAVLAHGRSGAGLSGAAWFAAGAALGCAALCLRAEVALA